MARSWLKRLAKVGAVLVALVAAKVIWLGVCETDGRALSSGGERADLLSRRDYLVARVTSPTFAVDSMASPDSGILDGEWRLGTLSMTAAALTNLAFEMPETRAGAVRVEEGIVRTELARPLREFDRAAWGEDPIDSLDGPHGHIGYLGHLAFTLGACRALGGCGRHAELHRRVVGSLARRLDASESLHAETYPDAIWTADNDVVVAAIAVADMVDGTDHRELIARFVRYTREHLRDPVTGIVVFNVTSDGGPAGAARGSAAGWASFYLPFADERFAREQWGALRRHLVKRLPFGITGIREFPAGVDGPGDVDSGPVLLELSPSGSGFAMAGARRWGDVELLAGLCRTGELAGFTSAWGGRHYLTAPLVGDAIVLAMKTATRWDRRFLQA